MRAGTVSYAQLSEAELLDLCRQRYATGGFEALTFRALTTNTSLYTTLYHRGLTYARLIRQLGLQREYAEHMATRLRIYAGTIRERWTWDRAVTVAKDLVSRHEHLPTPSWCQRNKLGALVHVVYRTGHTWNELRDAVGDIHRGRYVRSRNGLRWLSHAEASLSNFLYARGIEHRKGRRYPAHLGKVGRLRYAVYDLHFRDRRGRWTDVEVWGDNPGGHNPDEYERRRQDKERANSGNPRFLGISHTACYEESELERLLEPYI